MVGKQEEYLFEDKKKGLLEVAQHLFSLLYTDLESDTLVLLLSLIMWL